MAVANRPDVQNIWGSEGGITTPSLEQVLSGWKQNQIPPSDVANFLQNKIENAVAYFLQVGISDWHTETEYRVGSLVRVGSTVYLSKAVNLGKNPTLQANTAFWGIAFDPYGANNDIRAIVTDILNTEGYLTKYVSKANPVMDAKAKAPQFESDVGINGGFGFKNTSNSVRSLSDELHLVVGGNVMGRVKSVPATLEMNDSTLVTVELLKAELDKVKKASEIPIGWSVITSNPKPPSDVAQLGYGTWTLDCQGKAIVGLSKSTAVEQPQWTKDVDSVFGEYTHRLTEPELPKLNPNIQLGDGVTSGETTTISAGGGLINLFDKQSFPVIGNDVPHNNVQPSQVKYVWTRTA